MTIAAAARLDVRKLEQELAVAADRHVAIGLGGDPLAPEPAHPLEVVPAVVRVANRAGEQLGTARRDDDPTADLLHDLRGLAVVVRRHDHRPGDSEDAVQPTRDDVARKTGRKTDDVDEMLRQITTFVVGGLMAPDR